MNELVRDWKAEKKDLEEAFDIIADKLVKADAEIERLNKACETLRVSHRNGLALITELRDALVFYAPFSSEPHYRGLIQRAREATR